jgi:hypothetical protein
MKGNVRGSAADAGDATAAGEKARGASFLKRHSTTPLAQRQEQDDLDAYGRGYLAGWRDGWAAAAEWLRELRGGDADETR